jgi:peptide/nickel transport system substrate-binding protein
MYNKEREHMANPKKVSRRQFLRVGAMTAAGAAVVACAPQTVIVKETVEVEVEKQVEKVVKETVVVEVEKQVEKVVKETVVVEKVVEVEAPPEIEELVESPVLTSKVKAGQLPPPDERLPAEPLVVPMVESVGKYGGDWRMPTLGAADGAMFTRGVEYDHIARWDIDFSKVMPDIAKSWEVSDDASEFTFNLRKGMKWSDGEPYTSDDIHWWYLEQTNEELTPGFPTLWSVQGNAPEVVKVDDHTVKFVYPQSFGFFMLNLPQPSGHALVTPAHYRMQFVPDYGDAEFIEGKVNDAGVESWTEAYGSWVDIRTNPDAPTIHGWDYINILGESTTFIGERNAYYYKVDPDGQQLPYLERAVFTLFGDREAALLAAIAGEVDYDYRHTPSTANKPLFAENLEAADLRFVETVGLGAGNGIKLNLCVEDPVLNEIFNTKEFRVALSHALNRQEMIDAVALGRGTPHQAAPVDTMPHYSETMATQYLEYDPDEANAILDEILPDKNEDGVRLRPDGEPLQFTFDVNARSQANIDMIEMVKAYWEAVGVQIELNVIDRPLFYERFQANAHDANTWGSHTELLDPGSLVAVQSGGPSKWANAWAIWYETGGESGIEPPEPMKKNQETWGKIQAAPDLDTMYELMKEIVAVAEEEFWVIGTWKGMPGYSIVKNKFRNVPDSGISSWRYPDPGPYNTCQFFWDL